MLFKDIKLKCFVFQLGTANKYCTKEERISNRESNRESYKSYRICESLATMYFNFAYYTQSCNMNQRLSRACIVHLVIKKNNWSYVKTMSCSGSHLGTTKKPLGLIQVLFYDFIGTFLIS
jgi:hypothetical protein